ncbi:MAG TPA: hypothetical protein VE989_05450, partial [Sphingomicrobium sp.]|nr:hypothetical protein [Sphingomicrobium sp.]
FAQNKLNVCAIWIIMNGLGTVTSVKLAIHSYRINRRIRGLLTISGLDFPVDADDILPNDMTTWGGVANAFALVIMAGLWAYLALP